MYVSEVIIDGFKSYAARTHIKDWDPTFNAITGLNGSGKSNILDAICFVLGITNLSQVRASNLQDLVYKRGQAGISKASVTIVFNNEDSLKSPVGYEQYKQITVTRQILIGGRNKYMINGHNAQQQALANLFQSVQLNINNPHFLIMQGKITKVLNMKPPEILAMIEEAAGTRMFEERKDKALKTMAKKEKKLEEIKTILDEEITPKLDKLREEKRTYLEYQKVESEREFVKRLVAAYQYTRCETKLKENGQDFELKKAKLNELELEAEKTINEIATIEQEIKRIHELKAQSSEIAEMDKLVKEKNNDLLRLKTQINIKSKSLKEEEESLVLEQQTLEELKISLQNRNSANEQAQEKFKIAEQEYEREAAQVENDEQFIQTLKTGISAKEGSESGFMQRIQAEKKKATKLETEIENCNSRLIHLEKELASLKKNEEKALYESQELISRKEKVENVKAQLESELRAMDYDHEGEKAMLSEISELNTQIRKLKDQKNQLSSSMNNLEFHYSDPSPGFDRSKVKGLVAELFSIKDEKYSTALEICAGGKLYNVCVDQATTASSLINKGRLKTRYNFIPLDKVSPYQLSNEQVSNAKKHSNGFIDQALSLVEYELEVSKAMEFVFGGVLICDDPNSAKQVSSIKRIAKSVTLEGDVYEPSGTLHGGSKPHSSGIIMKFSQLQAINQELYSCEQRLQYLQQQLTSLRGASEKYNKIQKQIDLQIHQIHLIQNQIGSSTHAQIQQKIQQTEKNISDTKLAQQNASTTFDEVVNNVQQLEIKMKDFESDKGSKLKEMEIQLKAAKSKLNSKKKAFNELKKKAQVDNLELNSQMQDYEARVKNLSVLENAINDTKQKIENQQEEYSGMENELTILNAKLKELKEDLKKVNKELKDLDSLKHKKQNQLSATRLNVQKLNHEIERFEKDTKEAENTVKALEEEHPWILEHKSQFNKKDTNYDFTKYNMKECTARLQALEKQYDLLRKKINLKVMTLIDSVEKKETNLKQMVNTVNKDKKTIEATIVSLDNYKKEALDKTWKKVSDDFGSIFSDLLPGNTSKLVVPEGQTITEGLEVKVNLGGVWKHSLTELSGGQRSLIALSLILSLLQFKPAPMYILDEIDAALDLSHTQHIGELLANRFQGSQFIIVSLKEGMFSNANVLFKAKFRDGVSMVERTCPKK